MFRGDLCSQMLYFSGFFGKIGLKYGIAFFRAGSICSDQIFAPLPEREAGLIII